MNSRLPIRLRAATRQSASATRTHVPSRRTARRSAGERSRTKTLAPGDLVSKRHSVVSDSPFHTCALAESGEVTCWGWYGEQPNEAPPGRHAALSTGGGHSCALTVDGEAVCWGDNWLGQAEPPPGQYVAISAGDAHGCALTESTARRCAGATTGWARPNPPPGRYVAISAGREHTCALTVDGEAVCWGSPEWSDYGQADAPPGRYAAISAGYWVTCALTEAGEAVCWGDNRYGQTRCADRPLHRDRHGLGLRVRADRGGRGGLLGLARMVGLRAGRPAARPLHVDQRQRVPHLRRHH